MDSEKSRVFTSGEVAAICGVSPDTVSRWFDLGQIDGYRLGPGGDRRIPYESLRKFMLGHGIPIDRLEDDQKCVLVVDDDPYYLDLLPSILTKIDGLKIVSASTGFDAGALVAQYNPQLIILDIHLSDMDGRTVCAKVRSRPETSRTNVLAISGYLSDDEAEDLISHGFDDYLKKPFSVEDLLDRARRFLETPHRASAGK